MSLDGARLRAGWGNDIRSTRVAVKTPEDIATLKFAKW